MPELDWSKAPIHREFRDDWTTPEILLEGSLASGKTTVALDKEIEATQRYPGIQILVFRWTEDAVSTKLRVEWEKILSIRGLEATWDAKQKCYDFPNGSKVFMFGLKAVSQVEMFNKIRGLSVSRLCGDQVEECREIVAGELRGRLRPDLVATMRGIKFPFQLTFVANPSDTHFWLSEEFPVGDKIKGRRLISLSIFDNPFLPPETIEGLVRAWPEDHPCHLTMIQGKRGPQFMGPPVFRGLYDKEKHWRTLELRHDMPILESFEVGTENPTWVYGQAMYDGGIAVMGGLRGEKMMLEEFVQLVKGYRLKWFPPNLDVKTCVAPMGENLKATGNRYTLLDVLRKKLDIRPTLRGTGNAPDVRLAMIDNLGTYLKKYRADGLPMLGVNKDEDKFLVCDRDGAKQVPFVHYAFEAGFVWDENDVSVANKVIRKALEDDQFANAMHCIENIELNFLAGQKSPSEKALKRQKLLHQFDWMSSEDNGGEMQWGV